MHSLRQRLAHDEGFTLIELLVVLIIIGILLSIAIPSYLGFQKKAQQTAAMSDVRSAIPDAEAYYSDLGNYTAMTAGGLQTTYDSGLQVIGVGGATQGISKAVVGSGGAQTYCISAKVSGHWAFVKGPGGQVTNGDTTTPVTAAEPC
jgi:prepilin-type N-terminal cleavage/methylation domain-containing protein